MLELLDDLGTWGKAIVLLGATAAVVFGFLRWALPAWRSVKEDTRAIRDTLVGREAMTDSITGTEISPAVPSIGSRMASQEEQMSVLTTAVSAMANNSRRLDDLDERVTQIERGHLERMAGKVESIQLLRTMQAVADDRDAEADPPA